MIKPELGKTIPWYTTIRGTYTIDQDTLDAWESFKDEYETFESFLRVNIQEKEELFRGFIEI